MRIADADNCRAGVGGNCTRFCSQGAGHYRIDGANREMPRVREGRSCRLTTGPAWMQTFSSFRSAMDDRCCDALNAGLLPSGYSALVEQHTAGVAPDVLALERWSRPEPVGGVLTVQPPKTSLVRHTKAVLAARASRIAIRHRLSEVVCVIGVVSPGNKSRRAALRSFVEKAIEFLRQGVHLLIVDILPPTPRDPQGMHKAVWDEIEEEPFELPAGKP